ncbi:hypothetical protein SBA2_260111 [Acidobacteriia bacterium SbA2]|nr:hypothetical protein SBA2_260111 [Acidobacteriia bacterium SbA2]
MQTWLPVQGTPETPVCGGESQARAPSGRGLSPSLRDGGGKQTFVPVGNDPYVALDKLAEKQRWLGDRKRGVSYAAPCNPLGTSFSQI